jgi:two-component system, chemotaxis family, response regulator Rcp1
MIAAHRPVTMLMVEDNPADVCFFREALEETALPVTLHVVTNGRAAMEFLGRREAFANVPRPDVVVLDLNLPVMNGKELLAKMMLDPEFCRLPVAILTTSRSEMHLRDLYPPGRCLYFTKTDDFHRMQDIIRKIAAHAGM